MPPFLIRDSIIWHPHDAKSIAIEDQAVAGIQLDLQAIQTDDL